MGVGYEPLATRFPQRVAGYGSFCGYAYTVRSHTYGHQHAEQHI